MNINFILPEIILFSGALLILMLDAFLSKKFKHIYLASHLFSLLLVAGSIFAILNNIGQQSVIDGRSISIFNNSFTSNNFNCFAKIITMLLLTLFIVSSIDFVAILPKFNSEFIALIIIATVGGMIMMSTSNLLTFYLGLEMQSLSIYILAAFNRKSEFSSEAALKYFILGCLASGILLFGISMVYGYSGSINLNTIKEIYSAKHSSGLDAKMPIGLIFGLILILVAMFFKIGAAPFHMWVPDVYQGSSTMVAQFFGTIVKFTVFIALINLCVQIYLLGNISLGGIFLTVASLSLCVGSLAAIYQSNLKRLFAYSSISHVGFFLFGLKYHNYAFFYAVIYCLISLGLFAFLNLIKKAGDSEEEIENDEDANLIFNINSLAGLSKTNPFISAFFAIALFSSAGIPPFVGFISKFYVINSLLIKEDFANRIYTVDSGLLPFAIIMVVFSVISSFYYLRIVKIMYFDEPKNIIEIKDSYGPKFVLFIVAIANIILSIFPDQIISLVK